MYLRKEMLTYASSLQVLHGDIEEAICQHALYYAIWKRYGCLPERYNWKLDAPDVRFYPLRPELIESTYLLYQVMPIIHIEMSASADRRLRVATIFRCFFFPLHT